MTTDLRRRAALLIMGGAALPARAFAQLPQAVPPVTPPVVTNPTPPPPALPNAVVAAPVRPVRPLVQGIDRTKAYYVFFAQQTDAATMGALRQQLANLVDAGVSDITLVIDSPGGQIESVLVTYSFIQALPAKISTHAQGFVQSAATLLFLAGENRSADRYARFLFHPTAAAVAGLLNEDALRERMDAFDAIQDISVQIYKDRTTLPASEYDRFTRATVTYTAEQAQKFGIVQTVADLRIPGEGRARIVLLN